MTVENQPVRRVVLSVDYEIFGNGTGDVRQHVTEPTARMARLCREHDMPLTVFFETEEYLAFQREAAALKKDLGYDPALLMREQAAQLIRDGHDVQLHLHPQWVGARYEQGEWQLHPEHPTVDSLFPSQAEVTRYIGERRRALEETFQDVAPGRKVRAYRAGAFAAQPGSRLIPALAENGILIDSSVVKGMHRKSIAGDLDYRMAPANQRLWRVRRDVAEEDHAGCVWEIPIDSVMGRRLHQVTFGRLKAKFSRNVPQKRQKDMMRDLGISRNPAQLVRFLWQPVPLKLDFHNVAPAKLTRWIKQAPAPAPGELDVVMLIGHTKEHINDRAFGELLRRLNQESSLRVSSLDEIASLIARQHPGFSGPGAPASGHDCFESAK